MHSGFLTQAQEREQCSTVVFLFSWTRVSIDLNMILLGTKTLFNILFVGIL